MKKFIAIFLIVGIFFSGCLGKPTNTLALCENQPSLELRDACYFDNAVDSNELSFCTQIIENQLRNDCINSLS